MQAESLTRRQQREEELRRSLTWRVSNPENLDLSLLTDVELDGLISLAGRGAAHREERGEQPRRRNRRR